MFTVPRRGPRHVMARTIALSGTALVAAALLAWSPQPTVAWNQSSAEATLWQLLNGDRVNNGLQPLTQHSTLVSLARWRSKDMVDRNYFDHTILGTSYQIYHWYDSNGLSWSSGGENIGWNSGYADADSPVAINDGFMNSSGHRANILNPNWTHGGVGAYGADGVTWQGSVRNMRMYTELFIQLKSGSASSSSLLLRLRLLPGHPQADRQANSGRHPSRPRNPRPCPPRPRPPHRTRSPSRRKLRPRARRPIQRLRPRLPAESPAPGSSAPGASSAPDVAVSPLRVETADAADRGIFETVIGSLLSFFLG